MNDNADTLKIPRITEMNEMEYAQYKYDEALKAYLAKPSYENRAAFVKANQVLIDTRYAYNKGADLMRTFNATQTYTQAHIQR